MPAPALRIEIADPDSLDAGTRAQWETLAGEVATANPFYEPWMAMPAAALPEAAGWRLLLAWGQEGALVAVLPIQWRRRGPLRLCVQNWEQRVRALGEPLIRRGRERAFWDAALDAFDARRGFGFYLRLSTLDEDSASARALGEAVAARGRRLLVTRRRPRAVLRRGPSAADYIAANIRKKVLKEQKRLRNRLADQGELAFERLAADADAAPWIDTLFRLEMSGWKGREGVAAAADAQAEAAFRAVLTAAHARGRLDFHRLRVGERTLALLAVIEAGPAAFQLKIAYDEDHAAFSPGVLLEMAYLEHALAEGGPDQVDSCARDGHPMIDRIWVDRLSIVSLAVPFGRASSRLAVAVQAAIQARRQKRQAAKAIDP